MLSGGAMAGVGLLALWAGGPWFLALVVAVVATMAWELARLLAPQTARREALWLAGLAGVAVLSQALLPQGLALPLLLLPALAGLSLMPAHRVLFAVYVLMMAVAGFGLWHVRADFGDWGFTWMLWLALVVIVTDVAGYFAGRLIGGPKIWPAVSPKKTWAGTVAGWVGAGAVGLAFVGRGGADIAVVGVSVAMSMASQIGDVAESAVKRRMGAKDASNLIPGHGGVLDRFDGMLGAAVLLLLVERLIAFPPVIAG
jgi:phosphatidate cytidylyltransferase